MIKTEFNDEWIFYKENSENKCKVTLPHDAMLYEKRGADAPSGGAGAYFEGGIYHYLKKFTIPKEWDDQVIQLYFEGVYQNSEVFLNGKKLGGCAYGYSTFLINLNDNIKYNEENIVEVKVDNSHQPNSRWYTGSGIHRSVHLLRAMKKHIVWQGVKISTLSSYPAKILVETKHTGGQVLVEILKDGNLIAKGMGNSLELDIPYPKLWSDETPELYQCKVSLLNNDKVTDQAVESFGIRELEYSANGLYVNGVETLLRGGCIHHDFGVLGACSYKKAEWRRVKLLKETGFNAIRSSHNPCSEEMLKACDYYGVYVIDELWDMWYSRKNKFDYSSKFIENYELDIISMVNKDVNHPSVIMYSIGNEVSEPATKEGVEMTEKLVNKLHEMDSSRPVTAGFNLMVMSQAAKGKGVYKEEGGRNTEKEDKMPTSSLLFNIIANTVGTGINKAANSSKVDRLTSPAIDLLDIAGYNYASGRYPKEGRCHPERIIYGSETFAQDIAKNWAMVEKYPYLIGDFMWTAWDYIGEVGSGAWAYTSDGVGFEKPYPWLLADMGVLDILGNPNGEAFLAGAVWKKLNQPAIAVRPVNQAKRPAKSPWRGTNAIPSWSWRECEGKKATVEVYFDADFIELWLNKRKIGKKKINNYKAIFKTKYQKGKLEAVAFDRAGKEISRNELYSAEEKLTLRICPEEEKTRVGEIVYVNIEIVGQNGVVESNSDRELVISVNGGRLLGFGSANPRTEESFVASNYTTYYGRAQAIISVDPANSMKIIVVDGTREYTCEIPIEN